MKRVKRHKIKREKPETSSALNSLKQEHDLAYYIHDRVELMHQVFSVLKAKDLRAMAPECVRRLSIDDLEELCTEELLGISSKRLLAILDGAEPPSDTESSSQSSEQLETISLDSISSDEELLSQSSKKKKHKHRRLDSKAKKQKKKSIEETVDITEDTEKSKASRAGLTVLELLELQARARAIRAQLQQEQINKQPVESVTETTEQQISSDSEVEIKEEEPEVLEISSGDEKPTPQSLEKALASATAKETNTETDKNDKTTTAITAIDKETTTSPSNSKDVSKTATDTENDKDKTKTKKKKEKSKKKDKKKDSEKEIVEEQSNKKETEATVIDKPCEDSNKVTKRVNDLIITVPQASSRKIKLNRNKMTVSISNTSEKEAEVIDITRCVAVTSVVTIPTEKMTENAKKVSSVVSKPKTNDSVTKIAEPSVKSVVRTTDNDKRAKENDKEKTKSKDKTKKKKKKEKRQSIDEDHDEITLQLSDSEKMDLLEDFDRKNYDKVSSSSSDSESSSETSEDEHLDSSTNKDTAESVSKNVVIEKTQCSDDNTRESDKDDGQTNDVNVEDAVQQKNIENPTENSVEIIDETVESANIEHKSPEKDQMDKSPEKTGYVSIEKEKVMENGIEITDINDIPVQNDPDTVEPESHYTTSDKNPENEKHDETNENIDAVVTSQSESDENEKTEPNIAESNDQNEHKQTDDEKTTDEEKDSNEKTVKITEETVSETTKDSNMEDNAKDLSEGELSSNESSEVEAFDLKPEVVCISDEETPKKKKKKDKKAKKEKKNKSDFRENADQNFYKDLTFVETVDRKDIIILEDNDDVLEILELSDDSSCYEVEGTTLSKEPTVEEIAALSAKIDEIEREEVVTEEQIREQERLEEIQREKDKIAEKEKGDIVEDLGEEKVSVDFENLENMSWKERYLGSKKVKKVLTTSNILNALRKKNKQLKKKMEESKKIEEQKKVEEEKEQELPETNRTTETQLEEGSIEHYNTLQGSNKFVDPVPDPKEIEARKAEEECKRLEAISAEQKEIEDNVAKAIEMQVTGEMKKNAKQLLKMYKKLLKYNDVNKRKEMNQKDPNKKSKKKKKKNKEGASTVSNDG